LAHNKLAGVHCLLLDLDGVVYEGDTPLPGAVDFFPFMRQAGIHFRLVTNNSSRTRGMYVDKLARMGIVVAEDDVFTSGMATARHLAGIAKPGTHVFVIGETGLIEELRAVGFEINGDHPEYVVAGFDSHVTYEKLRDACLAISKGGATFIAANPDPYIPTEIGRLPGCGSICAFITKCTDIEPHVVGKPESEIFNLALKSMGMDRTEAAVIGDRLDTDILGGQRAGITTILTLTGCTSAAEVADSTIQPDLVFPDLAALRQALAEVR
jgi:4-nitrophenyl phosphatase